MTTELDEIRAILNQTAQQQQINTTAIAELRQSISETRAIADSNARSIAAWGGLIEENREEIEENTTTSAANLNRKMDTIAMGLRGLIQERRDDWAQFREQQAQQRQEFDLRFTTLIEDARSDRKKNEAEHKAFRETFQTLLAEIDRIWQRLAS